MKVEGEYPLGRGRYPMMGREVIESPKVFDSDIGWDRHEELSIAPGSVKKSSGGRSIVLVGNCEMV
jgi:hypothetical protein